MALPLLAPVTQSLLAAAKSQEIVARGGCVLTLALAGFLLTSIDEGMAARRTLGTCRTIESLIECDRDLALRLVSDIATRLAVLFRMATHLCEEASFPLQAQAERSLCGLVFSQDT